MKEWVKKDKLRAGMVYREIRRGTFNLGRKSDQKRARSVRRGMGE